MLILPISSHSPSYAHAGATVNGIMLRTSILAALFAVAGLAAERHDYACTGQPAPSSELAKIGGTVTITGTCSFTGNLVLDGSGTTAIVTNAAIFNLAGNLVLSQSASFTVLGGVFRLANRFKFGYAISASDTALFEMKDAELSTNSGLAAGSSTSTYSGKGKSILKFTNVSIDRKKSWLLANAYDNARVIVSNSKAPVEIYPTGSAAISISGPDSNMKVWLDLASGLNASIANLPDSSNPYTFSIGAGDAAAASSVSTNIRFRIDIVNAKAQFGFVSHPNSSLTMTAPHGPTSYSYFFEDPPAPIGISGEFVVSQRARISTAFTDSGRLLKLVDVPLPPNAWQVYSQAANGISQPVAITGSTSDPTKFVTLNEIGSFNGGNFLFDTVTCLWAVITAAGTGNISLAHSQIASQAIVAMNNGRVAIVDSTIYGSVIQARGNGVIQLINTPLLRVGDVPKPAPAGFPSLARNPIMQDPNAFPVFATDSAGMIVAATIDAFPGPIGKGTTVSFRGDAFIQSQVSSACTFTLSYSALGTAAVTPIAAAQPCPKLSRNAADRLGSLNTAGLTPGTYIAKLEIFLNGKIAAAATRKFTLN